MGQKTGPFALRAFYMQKMLSGYEQLELAGDRLALEALLLSSVDD
jgi:hypothetical protein